MGLKQDAQQADNWTAHSSATVSTSRRQRSTARQSGTDRQETSRQQAVIIIRPQRDRGQWCHPAGSGDIGQTQTATDSQHMQHSRFTAQTAHEFRAAQHSTAQRDRPSTHERSRPLHRTVASCISLQSPQHEEAVAVTARRGPAHNPAWPPPPQLHHSSNTTPPPSPPAPLPLSSRFPACRSLC